MGVSNTLELRKGVITLPPTDRSRKRMNSTILTAALAFNGMTFAAPLDECGPGAGDCCVAHENAGCEVPSCCKSVCAIDPYCCSTQWDGLCAGEAQELCSACGGAEPCVGPPCNYQEMEPCGEFTNGGCQSTGFEEISVGTVVCGTFWLYADATDVDWYSLTLTEATHLTINLYAQGVTQLHLMNEECDITVALDNAGCPLTVEYCAPAGVYRVLAERYVFDGAPCGSELSAYVLEVQGTPCSILPCGESQQDCLQPSVQPACAHIECCQAVCAVDPYCCAVAWDKICVSQAWKMPACIHGDPVCPFGGGDCCLPHSWGGCKNATCCEAVCGMDPFCCRVEWDQICVAEGHDYFLLECCCKVDWYCVGDLNGDQVVDGGDLGVLLASWGMSNPDPFVDMNFDNQVDGADLGILLGEWGVCKPPCLP